MFEWISKAWRKSEPQLETRSMSLANGVNLDGSGQPMTHNQAFTIASFWQAVSMISADVSRLDLILFEREPNLGQGAKTPATDLETFDLTLSQPNPSQNAYTFWRQMMTAALVWNHSEAWIRRDGAGRAIELVPLVPTLTRWDPTAGMWFTQVNIETSNQFHRSNYQLVGLMPDEVFSLTGLQEAGWIPELITYARDSLKLTKAADEFNLAFFNNGAQAAGILEIPATMTKTSRDNLEKSLVNKLGKGNWFTTMVLRDGVKWHQTSVDPEKSQVHEIRGDQVREIARWFNLPPSKLGLSDSVSYNSRAEDNRAYFEQAIAPWLKAITAEADFKLLTSRQRESRLYYYQHDLSSLYAADIKTQAEVGKIEIEMGAISPNEYRFRRNLNPRDGGDFYRGDESEAAAAQGDTTSNVEQMSLEHQFDDVYANAIRNSIERIAKSIRDEVNRKPADKFVDWFDRKTPRSYAETLANDFRPYHQVKRSLCVTLRSVDEYEAITAIAVKMRQECEAVLRRVEAKDLVSEILIFVEHWLDVARTTGNAELVAMLESWLSEANQIRIENNVSPTLIDASSVSGS